MLRRPIFLTVAALQLPLLMIVSAVPSHSQATTAKRIQDAVRIDGILNESAWGSSDAITGFIQFEPRFGEPSKYKTIIRILYDTRRIYFGITCLDPEPDKISSKVTRRDGEVWEDDSVAIVIDTFNDNSNAYMFTVNSLGTQQDERWADNGRTRDIKWDATWQSAGTRNDRGWSAEIAIPFESIRFDRDTSEWGLDAVRYVPRNLEMSHWAPKLTEWFRISEYGSLQNLNLKDVVSSRFTFIPYAQGLWNEQRGADGEVGLDIRSNLSSNIGMDITFNPDFATVEADIEQINLTRFELSYPEKRPFFLEGAENYSTRIRQFYSRRIGEIPWGFKINGHSGNWKFNGLATESDPSSANPSITPGEDAYYTVFRLGRELKNASNVGVIGANRHYRGQNKGSLGMVGTFFFTDVLGMTTQVIKSYGGFDDGTWTYFFRPSYDSRTTHFHVRYTYVGEHVRENMNDIGFITDDDRREFDTNIRRRFWINASWLEEVRPSVNYNRYYSVNGVLRSWDLDNSLDVTFLKKWSLALGHKEEYKLFEKDFRNRAYGAEIKYDTKVGNTVGLEYETGRNFDRDFNSLGAEVTLKLNRGWSLTYELKRVSFAPDPESDGSIIHNLRSTYYLNKDLFFKVFYQSRDVLGGSATPEEARETLQCIFVWRVLPPFGQIQLAYLDGPSRVTESADRDRSVFAKISWVFQK